MWRIGTKYLKRASLTFLLSVTMLIIVWCLGLVLMPGAIFYYGNWVVIPGEEAATSENTLPFDQLLAQADKGRGQKIATKCASCHNFQNGQGTKTGPVLWNIVGRDVASVSGFKYSKGTSALTGQWTAERLNTYLKNPASYVPGTNMNFVGLRKHKDRADIIAYLQTLVD